MSQLQGKRADEGREERMDFGVLVALGISLGAGVGAALGNVGLGSAVGLLVATIVNSLYERKEGKKGAGVALVIGIVALLIVAAILWTHYVAAE